MTVRFQSPPRFLIFLATLALWLAGVWFFSRNNAFPINYHPDEASKGRQIVSGPLNFHHPMLLLQSGRLLLLASGQEWTVENAVRACRFSSAAFASAAILLLAFLAYRLGGWLAALGVLVLLPLHPLLYELAHYAKEDPALLLGICLSLLLLDRFLEKPTGLAALWLGAGVGVALSGKYVGIVMLLTMAPLVWWKVRSWRIFGWFGGGFFATVLLINLPYLLHAREMWQAIHYEMNAVQLGGAKGLSREVPHARYLRIFFDNTGWPLCLGLVIYLTIESFRRFQRREFSWAGALLVLLPLGYALVLSFSPKTAERYFLVASPLLLTAAWLGWTFLLGKLPGTAKTGAGLFLLGVCAALQWQLTQPMIAGFGHDSRAELSAWIRENLPAHSALVAETRSRLNLPGAVVREAPFLPDLGSLDQLRANGIRYGVVIKTSYGGYLDTRRKPSKDQAGQHRRRADFYRELFARDKLLKITGGIDPGILNPEIRLYELGGN